MRKILALLVLLSPLAAEISFAQTNQVTVDCEDCRDPYQYPEDYVNFAFNQIYGPDAWMNLDQADDFHIMNSFGQSIYVDVDFVFQYFGFEGFRFPFWPRNLLEISISLPDGTIITQRRSVFQVNLPVGDQSNDDGGATTTGDGGGGGDEGDDDEDYNDDDDYEWEEPEYDDGPEGVVTIEDPDEDGNFEEWCEEC